MKTYRIAFAIHGGTVPKLNEIVNSTLKEERFIDLAAREEGCRKSSKPPGGKMFYFFIPCFKTSEYLIPKFPLEKVSAHREMTMERINETADF